MKVILLENIKGLGRKNEVKDVSSGYARNFLIPKNMAEAATPKALKKIADMKSQTEEERAKAITEAKKEAEKIKGKKIVFRVKTGEKGEMFGSVSAADMKEELRKLGVSRGNPVMEKPLKNLGEEKIEIDFGDDVKNSVLVSIESEKK